MKYFIIQIIIFIITVILLQYLMSLSHFSPYMLDGNFNGYNIGITLLLIFFLIQSILSTIIFLAQKFTAYGLKEFPNPRLSITWSSISSIIVIVSIVFNIYGVLDFIYSFLLLSLSFTIIYVILSLYGKKEK